MRDIRGDLQERGNIVEQEINAEHARFEMLLVRLKREQDSTLADLRAQLQAVKRLVEVANWQHNLRAAVLLAAAAVSATEVSAKKPLTPRTSSISSSLH
jgi:hypothetical protein